ncbi:Disrupted in renal carcinoma protein 2 [Portunus trituberculatus]|uniref:Disrupted in renal carcinoma protein 2 n=1 Tax=Portunus trituberculatus TaxID=210409 RepID=A0A5B7DM65_PORTR|nr:Disrupted in renal carcinoma protein 2 [Portunus trituberculatus]
MVINRDTDMSYTQRTCHHISSQSAFVPVLTATLFKMPVVEEDMEAILPEDPPESQVMLSSVEVKVYKRRWWILFLFAGMGFMQCAVWNTWGPITATVKTAYPKWDDAEIALLSMWGTITMITGLVPMTILLQAKGESGRKLKCINKNIWLLVVPYAITLGINVAWSSVLDINVAAFGIDQANLLFGYMKLTIICLMVVATAGYTWFLLLMNQCLPFSKVQLFISVIIGASFNYACSPLFFELAVELAYPVSEGVVGAFLTICWNIVAALFLFIMQTPIVKKSVLWMDYLLAIQGLVVVLMMVLVREEYRRTSVDKAPAEDQVVAVGASSALPDQCSDQQTEPA